jgi:hypothetical protein
MKNALIPSIRVQPQVRAELEAVLEEGETLSAFVENAARDAAKRRRTQAEFIARGLAARDEARRTGMYFTVEDVNARLSDALSKARDRVKAST